MGKTYVTKQLESLVFKKYFLDYSMRCALEVGFHGKRVDFVARDRDGVYIFVEIKQSLSDFRSKTGHNFYGDKNYYAMPADLYEKVKDKIPKHIGVLVPEVLDYGVLGYNKFQLMVVKSARKNGGTYKLTSDDKNYLDKSMLTACNSTISRLLRDYRYEITDEAKAREHLHRGYV